MGPLDVGKHFFQVTVLLQFDFSRIIKFVVQLTTGLKLHGNLAYHARHSIISDHKIWEIFQNQCLLIDFRVRK